MRLYFGVFNCSLVCPGGFGFSNLRLSCLGVNSLFFLMAGVLEFCRLFQAFDDVFTGVDCYFW